MKLSTIRNSLSRYCPIRLERLDLIQSAVIILIYEVDGQSFMILTRRSNFVEAHKGEIAFPGGVCLSNESSIRCALREMEEEIGISSHQVDVFSELDQEITSTGFVITPFIGILKGPFHFRLNEQETAEILSVPDSSLRAAAIFCKTIFIDDIARTFPSINFQGRVIWGATARIIQNYLALTGEKS